MFNKTYNVCNNCGKQGHLYNNCKIPITSYGVISFRNHINYEYLMICRKDSLGYVDFIRGKYPLYNKKYIQNLIDEMTIQEKENILTKNFDELWNKLWCSDNGMQYRVEEKSSKNKFEQIKRGIQLSETDKYDVYTLIKNSKTQWETPEWGFPKGRRNWRIRLLEVPENRSARIAIATIAGERRAKSSMTTSRTQRNLRIWREWSSTRMHSSA